jgi:hypothetical protein
MDGILYAKIWMKKKEAPSKCDVLELVFEFDMQNGHNWVGLDRVTYK